MTKDSGLGQWPQARKLMAVIRSLAEHSDPVLLDHAEGRMLERDIDMLDVLRVLRTGEIVGTIEPGINADEWKCKVTASPRYPDNSREIGVVTIVVRASRLLVKTVEWEDEYDRREARYDRRPRSSA